MRRTLDAINVVQADFKLTNRSSTAVTDITLQISYQNVEGEELAVSEPIKIASLAPGESMDVTSKTASTPSFETYEVRATFNAPDGTHRLRWYGAGPDKQPLLVPGEPVAGDARLMILGQALAPTKPGGPLTGAVRLRNVSTTAVEQLTAKVTFYDGDGPGAKVVGSWSSLLGDGKLGAGEEKVLKLTVDRVPKAYTRYNLEFNYVMGEKLTEFTKWCGGEFTETQSVQAAHWKFQRQPWRPENLAIEVDIWNRLPQTLERLTVIVKFLKKDNGGEKVLRQVQIDVFDEIKPDHERTLQTVLEDFNIQFDAIQREIAYRTQAAPQEHRELLPAP